ncbi:NDP-sugar synthase [bacterium]|nr:NDP-sugar synthase [bacterium]
MKAMILAAGVGSRLDPLTRNLPKPLVPIANKPVIEHIIESLREYGFRNIMINLHYLGEKIKDWLGDGEKWGVSLQYSFEKIPLGTAGGVKKVEDFFDGTFLVVGADDLCDIDLRRLLAYHQEKKAMVTIALSLVDDPSEYGVVLTNERGRVIAFLEKPRGERIPSNTVNTGIYIIEPEILQLIPKNEFFDFGKDLFPLLIDKKVPFYGYLALGYWKDVGNIKHYKEAHKDVLYKKVSFRIPYKEVKPFFWMGENVEIEDSAFVEYPVVIGNGCVIKKGAKILEGTVLGDGCVIEEGAIVKQSILWKGARIDKNTMLEACIVGEGCEVYSNAAIFDGIIVSPIRK